MKSAQNKRKQGKLAHMLLDRHLNKHRVHKKKLISEPHPSKDIQPSSKTRLMSKSLERDLPDLLCVCASNLTGLKWKPTNSITIEPVIKPESTSVSNLEVPSVSNLDVPTVSNATHQVSALRWRERAWKKSLMSIASMDMDRIVAHRSIQSTTTMRVTLTMILGTFQDLERKTVPDFAIHN